MSLINEALRRAEGEHRSQVAAATPGLSESAAALELGATAPAPAPLPVAQPAEPPRVSRVTFVAVSAGQPRGPDGPPPGMRAGQFDTVGTAPPPPLSIAEGRRRAARDPSATPSRGPGFRRAAVMSMVLLLALMTMAYLYLPQGQPADVGDAPAASDQAGSAAEPEMGVPAAAKAGESAERSAPPYSGPLALMPVPAEPVRTIEPPRPMADTMPALAQAPAVTAAQPPEPPMIDAGSEFRLGGIIQSGGTAHALINDHMVAVGDELCGARVVSIQRNLVVLERAGKRMQLRM